MDLHDVVQRVRKGGKPRRGIALSFDDGYMDNLLHGVPLLERYDVPATVFVAAGYIDGDKGFWWDRLARLVNCWKVAHGPLAIGSDEAEIRWQLNTDDSQARGDLEHRLHEVLAVLKMECREDALSRISTHVGLAQSVATEDELPLSRDQLHRLGTGDLVSIGSHTITHRRLLGLPIDELEYEVGECKRRLMEVTGRAVDLFSYPFGWRGTDYDDAAVKVVRDTGYSGGFCSRPAPARRGDNPYEIPRLWVNDMDGDEFARQLRMWWGR